VSLDREPCGASAGGHALEVWTLERGSLRARFTNLGASLMSLEVPGRDGATADVVLGFDTPDEYEFDQNPYFGGMVGRVANRIGGASFVLDGKRIGLTANEGRHHLHGGRPGFDRRVWAAEPDRDGFSVTFRLRSLAGEQGYPGELDVAAVYSLASENELVLRLEAACDAATVVNLTQHAYFNLAGGGRVLDHFLEVAASKYVVVDRERIPTGEVASVANSPFDLRTPRRLGESVELLQTAPAGGLDHCFVLDSQLAALHGFACRLSEQTSGRVLELSTTQPGLQVYTGNGLGGILGKQGLRYPRWGGVCLEAQAWPDAVHHGHFPTVFLRPGEKYQHTMRWRFSCLA